jgi:hypothetical protein
MQVTPARCTAAAHVRARSTARSTGFSQKIALPAAAARMMRSACVSVDEPITTAPTFGSASAVSDCRHRRVVLCGERRGGGGIDVDHVAQLDTRLPDDIGCVDLADPACAKQCDFHHCVTPFVIA